HDVRVPASAVTDGVPVGRSEVAMFDRYLSSGAFHAAASLGVAEAAHELAVVGATKRRGAHPDEGWVRSQVAASTFDLYAMRSAFDRAAHLCDEVDALDLRGEASAAEWAGWFAEVQSAKAIVCDGAVRVVDRALALSGGAGFFASHPLAKAYRDVRACGFMHPLGANRASGFVADVSLGDVPVLR
ncbi:MAG TPA: acyl-CoA dehydrogenase family protein, partial [Acidimicrobiales bacterium]|nr:acyl-CoA dehydrogenase family protein [Acidimicrobiales bacterium]